MCESFFKIKPSDQVIFHKTGLDPVPIAVDGDGDTLSYLGIEDGHTILIDEIDTVLLQREAEKQSLLEVKLQALKVGETPTRTSSSAQEDT